MAKQKSSKAKREKRPNVVSVRLDADLKKKLDEVCDQREMTVKTLLDKLVDWFSKHDKTEQSIILGQIEESEFQILLTRTNKNK